MRNRTKLGVACLYAVAMAGACLAQNPAEPSKYFRLHFAVKELEGGKVTNTRQYAMTVATGDGIFTIRTGNKVPVPTGGPHTSSYQYVDVGVNFDCRRVKELENQLALNVSAEISSAAAESHAANGDLLPPVIRQSKWSSNVIVPLGKPTTIFSSDDPTGNRRMQLELTATPIR